MNKSELIIEAKITANNRKYGHKDFVGCLNPIQNTIFKNTN